MVTNCERAPKHRCSADYFVLSKNKLLEILLLLKESRRSDLGATVSTASGSRPARSVPNASEKSKKEPGCAAAFKVPSGLGVVVGALPTGSVTACNCQSSESDVVHDHIRPRQHHIVTVACMGIRVRSRHVKHASTVEGGETVGGSSSSGQLGPGGCSAEMISDGCSYANREVLIKGVGENLLPTARSGRLCRFGPSVAAPGTRNRHTDLFCDLVPGQASVAQLQDLLCGGGMCGRTAASQGDAGPLELLTDHAPMNAQLGTDLAQAPALGFTSTTPP